MGRTFRAARVFETAKQRLYRRALTPAHEERTPPWLAALEAIPPSDCTTRPHIPRSSSSSAGSPSARARARAHKGEFRRRPPHNVYLPRQLVYEEDELRSTFFRDHPWELARPRIVLELDGKDARYVDWSRGVRQPGMPLSGECVVQRQLWLMHNVEGMTKEKAYDEARREFYALRHEEEVERRIAQEEARMVGGVFGKSALQIGMELEDKQYEKWKKWAAGEMNRLESERSGAISSYGEDAAPEDDLGAELAKIG